MKTNCYFNTCKDTSITKISVLVDYPEAEKVLLSDGNELVIRKKDGFISWAKDWCLVYEYARAKLVSTKFYKHLYGHTDYYFI